MMASVADIMLPHGYWIKAAHHRECEIRALTGQDEEFLSETADSLLPAERVTALLARCVRRLEGYAEVDAKGVRELTIGDREALLLHVRRLTLGERMQCTLRCPRPECKERMDIELNVDELLQPPYETPQPVYEAALSRAGSDIQLRFRLPTGLDQELVVRAGANDPESAALQLLRRCLLGPSVDKDDDPEYLGLLAAALPGRMVELDPQAELMLDVSCPVCGHGFTSLLDMGDFLFSEITACSNDLYQQVHTLALHYHWSESEIMRMGTVKRHRYLDLLYEDAYGRALA